MRTAALLLALALVAARAFAQGGPPLLTDDPDPPGDGHWEINAAVTLQSAAGVRNYEIPHVDVNYGWGDSVQLKLETGVGAVSSPTTSLKAGMGGSLIGVKWRIRNGGEEGISFGTYPQLGGRVLASADPRLAGPSAYAVLPVEVKWGMGELALDFEGGLLLQSGAGTGFVYGACAGYNVTKLIELLAELHGTAGNSVVFPPGLAFQVGTRAGLSEAAAIIAAAGATEFVPSGGPSTLLLYLGTRLTL